MVHRLGAADPLGADPLARYNRGPARGVHPRRVRSPR